MLARQCERVPLQPDLLKLASAASRAVRDNAVCQNAMRTAALAAPVEGASSSGASSSKDGAAGTLVQPPAQPKRFTSLEALFEKNAVIDGSTNVD